MLVKIDDFGRMLIPKRIRDHLGLTPGITIKLEEKSEKELVIHVIHERPALAVSDGVLVFRGTALTDNNDGIDEVREERYHRLARD